MPKGPRPRAHEALRRDVPGLQDAQRRKKFAPEKTLTPPVARQRAQRLHQRVFAKGLAEIALDAPHRHHRGRVHAKALFGTHQRLAVLRQTRRAIGHAFLVHQRRHVIPNGHPKLRLKVQLLDHAEISLQPRRVARPSVIAHLARASSRAQLGHAG